ncbi:MAG: hypothetical protein AAF394_07340 [Planctomycetota bacterium]
MPENPFDPPASLDDESPEDRAKRLVSQPATALIILSSIHAVFDSIGLVNCVLLVLQRHPFSTPEVINYVLLAMHFSSMIVISIGAAQLGHLKSRCWARVGAVLACVPMLTPFLVVGITFGIWSLMLLGDAKIEAAWVERRNKAQAL